MVARAVSGDGPDGTFERWLDAERGRIDREIEDIARGATGDLSDDLRAVVAYALSTRGKRLRPILLVAAYRAVAAVDTVPAPVYRLGCAVEIVHTYSLVHDDLPCMDDDDLRRGRPTVHTEFGAADAIIAGAALLPIAIQTTVRTAIDLGLGSDGAGSLVRDLCVAAGAEGMVGGQLSDLLAETRDIGIDQLEQIHRAKTGALLTAALRMGGIAGGCDTAGLEELTRYGRALGLAFQITDDVLDVAGSTPALGKVAGRDEQLGKASYPALLGLERAREMAHAYAEEARASLRQLRTTDLIALADFVVRRER
jgi:geranylgeranyl pyrophosphate synthase